MKKKIFLSLLVVVGLFMITGCNLASQEEQNKQEPKQADQHSLNNGDQTPTNDDENQPTDDEPQDDTSEENLAKRLIGKWKYENSETGVIDIYTFRSNGTAMNEYEQPDNASMSGKREFTSYKFDGTTVSMYKRTDDGDLYSIQMDITLGSSSFKDRETGNVYKKIG